MLKMRMKMSQINKFVVKALQNCAKIFVLRGKDKFVAHIACPLARSKNSYRIESHTCQKNKASPDSMRQRGHRHSTPGGGALRGSHAIEAAKPSPPGMFAPLGKLAPFTFFQPSSSIWTKLILAPALACHLGPPIRPRETQRTHRPLARFPPPNNQDCHLGPGQLPQGAGWARQGAHGFAAQPV